jgi:hypothetical protein
VLKLDHHPSARSPIGDFVSGLLDLVGWDVKLAHELLVLVFIAAPVRTNAFIKRM